MILQHYSMIFHQTQPHRHIPQYDLFLSHHNVQHPYQAVMLQIHLSPKVPHHYLLTGGIGGGQQLALVRVDAYRTDPPQRVRCADCVITICRVGRSRADKPAVAPVASGAFRGVAMGIIFRFGLRSQRRLAPQRQMPLFLRVRIAVEECILVVCTTARLNIAGQVVKCVVYSVILLTKQRRYRRDVILIIIGRACPTGLPTTAAVSTRLPACWAFLC